MTDRNPTTGATGSARPADSLDGVPAPPVLYDKRASAAWITLNRPHRRNALSSGLVNLLATHLRSAMADDDVRFVVLTGSGDAFCAGADLKDPEGQPGNPSVEDERESSASPRNIPFSEVLTLIWEGPKPVLVAVNGAAFGGGLGLLGAADIVVTAAEATFSFSEVRIGVIPAIISVVCLRKLGRHQGMRLFLTGEQFSGTEAVTYGLAHIAVPKADLTACVERQVEALRCAGPLAVIECKRLVREIPTLSVEDGFELATEWSARMFRGEEAREGMAAFREKRRPSWCPEDEP